MNHPAEPRADFATPPPWLEIRYDVHGTLVDSRTPATAHVRYGGLSDDQSEALCAAICAQVDLATRWRNRGEWRDDPWA